MQMDGNSEVTIIPAHPGYFVIQMFAEKDGNDSAIKHPVIGWEVTTIINHKGDTSTITHPVTLPDVITDDAVILTPTGRVYVGGFEDYDNLEQYIEVWRKQQARAESPER